MSTYYNLTLSTRSSTWLNLLIEWSGNFFNPTLRWRGLSKYLGNARSLFIEIEPTLTDSVLKNISILFITLLVILTYYQYSNGDPYSSLL